MKRLLMILAILGLALSVQAQDVELRDDHPREYVVQEGDTLWGIASRFLTRPWQWPAIWQANPQIDNPHLIFPGDLISLEFVGGEPRLTVNQRDRDRVDDSILRLGPEIRRQPMDTAITTIPLDAIEPFLRRPRVVGPDELENLPYVIANQERITFASAGERSYVRGLEGVRVGEEVIVARVTYQFVDRSATEGERGLRRNQMRRGQGQVPSSERPMPGIWRVTLGQLEGLRYPVIGYELWESARARVVKLGDPAIIELLGGRREVAAGDYVLPVDDHIYNPIFQPKAMEKTPENARVLTISEAFYGVGHYQIVSISVGTADGVEAGHTFSAFRPGERIRDELRYPLMSRAAWRNSDSRFVELPHEYAGQVMVFRPFERISYAIVMDGANAIRADDLLFHPDRRL
ncbi:MAG: LysM domain-containing protein [Wenzhouxiangella sp.]|nr:LysM domain-containing protein [Wenzhouxiangella sp.]